MPSPARTAELLGRLIAAGSAALVLALTIFAASPVAHDWLHANDRAEHCANKHAHHEPELPSDDGCAIVLFASGVSLPVDPVTVIEPTAVVAGVSPVTAAEVFLVSPRYLRQPERGPPAS